ncbi:MAG: helix-turn-helix transcriptional regulator [Verrucomicrobia subdivision 3 bacterium]|nr:helix-turn-helix transcriptional regulator [Limisphaerales bacterium]
MPRKNPMPEREQQICARLRVFRESTKLSRATFAREIGVDQFRLASYELGRAPLRYGLADLLCAKFNVNQRWLATGLGEQRHYYDIYCPPSSEENQLFSLVFDRFLDNGMKEWDRGMEALAGAGTALASNPNPTTGEQSRKREKSPAKTAAWYVEFLIPYLVGELPLAVVEGYVETMLEAHRVFLAANDGQIEALADTPNVKKSLLDNITVIGKHSDVKLTMHALLARLNKATTQHGMKSKLAKYMGVPLPNVSQWLSGEREPAGETTLRLLTWVEQQERKT